jgi:glutamine cyclotransferase
MKYLFTFCLPIFLWSCNSNQIKIDNEPNEQVIVENKTSATNISYSIISQYPHDTGAYTQGLEFSNDTLFESTGDYENSSIRITDFKSGRILKIHKMGSEKIFGEGMTSFKNKIYQLTWESNVAYVYNVNNIEKPINTFQWPYEGWGITHDSTSLIISDGSSNLYFVDPETFKVRTTIAVTDEEGPVNYLNELEYVDGVLYANVYQTNYIVKIDAESGHVIGKLTLNNLLQQSDNIAGRTDVLNGIAYNNKTKTFFITGKRWPKMFEMRLN